MSLDVGSQNAGRRERGTLTASPLVDETHLGSARRKLVSDGRADDAGADDRDLHVTILVGSWCSGLEPELRPQFEAPRLPGGRLKLP